MMDPALRGSAALVLVADVRVPVLDSDVAHHLRRVLRLRGGAAVTVTDGAGSWRPCAFTGAGVEPAGDVTSVDRSDPELTVAVAPPKGDRLDWLVAKATEVGIDRIVLLEAERSVVRLQPERAERRLDRLHRIAAEAAMQSRRVWLPSIDGPEPAGEWLARGVVAEPGGRQLSAGDTTVVIGPEGGWSERELAGAADTVSLGPTVLRVETAAVVAATMLVTNRSALVR
jgi:16S rRNA (uracil1498-N3)-methyltransferase